MVMKVVVGHSADPDTPLAVSEVVRQCREKLGDVPPRCGIVFACMEADHKQMLVDIRQAFPGLPIVGCSTDGELSSILRFQEDSIALMILGGEKLQASVGVGRGVSESPKQAAVAAIEEARRGLSGPAVLCVAFPESLTASGVSIVRALSDALGPEVLLTGGTSGDQWCFKGTHQFFGEEVLADAVPVLLLGGDVVASVGIASGWRPMGRRATVTRAKENRVYEIDGVPALAFYKSFLGDHVVPNPEYPLGVYEGEASQFYLRAPLSYDQSDGSITFAGDIPENAAIQITEAARADMLSACEDSVASAREQLGEVQPSGALVVSCAARKQLLGTRTELEYNALCSHLSPEVPVLGFYSYGEIAPIDGRVVADFHNETFVTVLFGSREP